MHVRLGYAVAGWIDDQLDEPRGRLEEIDRVSTTLLPRPP